MWRRDKGMASKDMSVWSVLRRLGHRGPPDLVCQAVFERAAEVVDLATVFEALGGTRDWPEPGSQTWRAMREDVLRLIVMRLRREGNLDAIACGSRQRARARRGGEGRAMRTQRVGKE